MIYTIEIFEEYDFSKFGHPIQSKSYNDVFLEWQQKMRKTKSFEIMSVEQVKNSLSAGIFVVYKI